MANYLDTGDTGRAVSAETDGALFAGIFGNAKYVLGNGSQFKAEVQSNNIVKISDGDAVMYGRHVRIPANDSALVTINNGHSGTNRIDLIVFRYTKDSTGKETVDLAVIQGEDSTGTAAAPATIDGDILTGAMQADFPLYRVELNGLNIVSVTAMFDVIGNISQLTKTNKDLSNKLAEISQKMTGKYAYAYTTYLDAEKSTKTSLTLNSIKATGHGRKCILMCWGAVKVTTLTARLSVYVNGKDSCSGITSSTSYVPVFDSNIITLPEGENTIEIRLSAQANTATAYIGRYHKLGFIVAEL
jgi:hypothetical protein